MGISMVYNSFLKPWKFLSIQKLNDKIKNSQTINS